MSCGPLTFKIDNVQVRFRPTHVEEVVAQRELITLAGGRQKAIYPNLGKVIKVHWGVAGHNPQLVIRQLRSLRGEVDIHALAYGSYRRGTLRRSNVSLSEIGYAYGLGHNSVDEFDLDFPEVQSPFETVLIEIKVSGTLSTGDGRALYRTQSGGKILAVGGYLENTGTGAGQTRVQVRNVTDTPDTDYLSTRGDFTPGGDGQMINQVLATNPIFQRGDQIAVDVDTIPAGADSANLRVFLWAKAWRA